MRKFLVLAAALAALPIAACRSVGTCGDVPEPQVVEVYDDPPMACAPSACDPCAGGACAMPQVRVVEPAVVGEYGYVLGPPGAREQFGSVVSIPPRTLKCLVDGGHRILVDALDTGECVLKSLYPPEPAPSQRLVRLQRVQRPPGVVRPRATNPCRPPAPPPPQNPDGEPPPSIPAGR